MADALYGMNFGSTVTEVTFSLMEASTFLRVSVQLLMTLLRIPGMCPAWEAHGRISESTVRLLYAKLSC